MDRYLLSIIIPIYNLERYINKCLDTIVSQTEEDVEVILIDDGSTDNSKTICETYCNKYNYINYFYQKNSGVSIARNNGLEKAKGEFILFIDGDDWILDGTIKNIIHRIKRNSNVDIIAGDFIKEFDEKQKEIEAKKIPQIINEKYPNNIVMLFEKKLFNPSLCCNVFRKELFIKNNICLDRNVKYTEDMDCTLKLFLNSTTIDILEKPFYVYRQAREGSATNKVNIKRVEDTMNFVINWDKTIKELDIDEKIKDNIFFFMKYQYSIVVGMLFLLNKEERKNIYYKVKKYEHLLIGGKGKKGILVHYIYKIFGFKIVGKLMALWIKYKNKIRR